MVITSWRLSFLHAISVDIWKKLWRNKLGSRTPGSRGIRLLVRSNRIRLLNQPITLVFNCRHPVHLNWLIAFWMFTCAYSTSLLRMLLRVDHHCFLCFFICRTLIISILLKLSCVLKLIFLFYDLWRVFHQLGVPCRSSCLLNEVQRFILIIIVCKTYFMLCMIC